MKKLKQTLASEDKSSKQNDDKKSSKKESKDEKDQSENKKSSKKPTEGAASLSDDRLSLDEQMELKNFLDNEIGSKMKTIVKNRVVKLFQQYAMHKDMTDLKSEQEENQKELADLQKNMLQQVQTLFQQ